MNGWRSAAAKWLGHALKCIGHVDGLIYSRAVCFGLRLDGLRGLEVCACQRLDRIGARLDRQGLGLLRLPHQVERLRVGLLVCLLCGKFLGLFLVRLDGTHAQQATAVVVAHLAHALAFEVHQNVARQHLLCFRVLDHLQDADEAADGGSAAAGRRRADFDIHLIASAGHVVLDVASARLGINGRLVQDGRSSLAGRAQGLGAALTLYRDIALHGQPDFPAALHRLAEVVHVDSRLHVQPRLDQFQHLAADVRLHLFACLLITEQILQRLACKLGQGCHRGRDFRALGVADGRIGHHLACSRVNQRVDQQIGVLVHVVARPHVCVGGDLLRRQDGLRHVVPGADLRKP